MATSASDVSFLKGSERDLSSKMRVSSLPVLPFDFSVSPSPAFRQGRSGGVRELWNYPHFDVLSVIAQESLIRRTLRSLPRLKQPQDLVQKVAWMVMEMNCYCYCLVTKLCLTLLRPHGLQPTSLLCPWGFPGNNSGLGCHFLLQGIFLTQGSNLCLLHWQVDS